MGETLEILVPKTVYPPREDSRLLIDCINKINQSKGKAMEIGCGTGIISINLAKKGWVVEALDINPYAIISTKENIIRARVDGLVSIQEGGLGEQGFRISEEVELLVASTNKSVVTIIKGDLLASGIKFIGAGTVSDIRDDARLKGIYLNVSETDNYPV